MGRPTGLVIANYNYFFHKSAKLAMLAIKADAGRRKINSAEK